MTLPIRTRLTLVSAGLMAVLVAAAGVVLFIRLDADLTEAADAGLRSRAQSLLASVSDVNGNLGVGRRLIEPEDAFAQVLGPDGRVVEASLGLEETPVLSPEDVAGLAEEPTFFERVVRATGESISARLLATPVGDGRILVVGSSLDDQHEALNRLKFLLAVGGPVALLLATGVGWVVAGAALRPVERMRAEAAAISGTDPGRRLAAAEGGDELARLGRTLNEMLDRLESALERERRFVGDASHELRTPLANLRTELELALRRDRSPEELRSALASAAEEAERLGRLAEDLLVVARAEGGRLPVRPEEIATADVIAAAVEDVAARAGTAGVAVRVHAEHGLRAKLDPARMRQALGNLLGNAVAHSERGGRVDVTAATDDGALRIEVADSGSGFPSDFLAKAFEPFARPDAARARTDGGSGLGLAIVKAIAEAHGGTVEAANRPGGGASVVMRLPQ